MTANVPELVHSGDTTDEADDENDGGEERDDEDGDGNEDEDKEVVKEDDEERTKQDHDEHSVAHSNELNISKETTAGFSQATAIIAIDDDTEPDTEPDPEPQHSIKTTNVTAHSSPTSAKRKAAALSAHSQLQQDSRLPRRRRLFAPPAPSASTATSASRMRRTSPPPPMSPTRFAQSFSDVQRSSRKIRTVQQLERNPDAISDFAPLPSFTSATATGPVTAIMVVEPPCAAETCPILLSLGLNPFDATQDVATVYDPLSRTHIPFPISTTTAARAHADANPKHKHDRHTIHQAVHVWQRQKSRLSTLAGLVDDDWVKAEIKGCVIQMGAVVGEAWRELWYCEDEPEGHFGGLEGEAQGEREVDKENTCVAPGVGSRAMPNRREIESRVLRVREEGLVYVQAELDPRSPMPMPAANPRTPMVQRVAGSTSPTNAGSASPKKTFPVFTDKDYKSTGNSKECVRSQRSRR